MPAFLEAKLKNRYGAKSSIPYAIMNKLGYMHGNKETAAGRNAQKKHERDYSKPMSVGAMMKRHG